MREFYCDGHAVAKLLSASLPGGESDEGVGLGYDLLAGGWFEEAAVVEEEAPILNGVKASLADEIPELEEAIELEESIVIQAKVEGMVACVYAL